MGRVYNFSAGPSTLPVEVLENASNEMITYRGEGMSVMEMSHRSSSYQEIIEEAEELLRKLMHIPDQYKVLFLQGGASTQFAMVPLNLFKNKKADYVDTGAWSNKAIKEAKKYGEVNLVASSEDSNYTYIPNLDKKKFSSDADYFYITTNNTIYGTRYTSLPQVGQVPLVADMSSNILSEVYDINKFGVIFAGAQKNMGPAGVTVVIIREDLIGEAMDITPTMLRYKTHADKGSMFNTPPTYNIYICKLVFEWLMDKGGVEAIEQLNIEKASILYNFLDESNMFSGTAKREDRSLMNIPFLTKSSDLDNAFITEAKKLGLVNLKGHRSVGGMRASIYNALPVEGVLKLVNFMKDFEIQNKNY